MSSLTALRLVHPRLRGELFDFFNVRWLNNGSSPLTRGTHTFIFCQLGGRRFIPAYAGNSALACSRRARRSVHPRLRGELILVLRPALIHIGSSPLTRGTLRGCYWQAPVQRFIPAYAGNSGNKASENELHPVHPRLRGELRQSTSPVTGSNGSSPLTRGTRHPRYKDMAPFPVHPRLRGELILFCQKKPKTDGSSPLTRGTHSLSTIKELSIRFIPAYAGNSLKDGINPSIHTLGI